jgi:hypothetical protein
MIKVEVFRKEGKGTTTLIFESRDTSSEGLDKLDEAYNALLGSSPKRGGYLGSNRFEIEVKDLDQ